MGKRSRAAAIDRFRAKVAIQADGCLVWMASTDRYGYGGFRDGRRQVRAHRWYYEYVNGPVPDGLVLDHLCRNRPCVNPDHLRAVTQRANMLAPGSMSCTAANAAKTHCFRGHRFVPENIAKNGRQRWRKCRSCSAANWLANKARKRTGLRWTEEEVQAYADRKYAEFTATSNGVL